MNSVIIVAAGKGSRMNSDINKQYIKIMDKEILCYTLKSFSDSNMIDEIIVVIKEEEEDILRQILIKNDFNKNIKIAYGGKERQDSVYSGLKLLDEKCEIVLVHDGARPFIDKNIIEKSIIDARINGSVIVGVKVKDTIKKVDKIGIVKETLNRDELWSIQTPQVFKKDIILKSYEYAYENNFFGTDDASLVENAGYPISMVEGSYKNIKITTPEDIIFALAIIQSEVCYV